MSCLKNSPMHENHEDKMQQFNSHILLAIKETISRGKRKKHWVSLWKDVLINSLVSERDQLNELNGLITLWKIGKNLIN